MEKVATLVFILLIGGAWGEVSTEYKDYIVKKHNDYRRLQKSSNINKLVWNDTLADMANKWLSKCDMRHEGAGFGENLNFETVPKSDNDNKVHIESAFKNWYGEMDDFTESGCGSTSSCHYSQLVWYSTRQVGCAHQLCSGEKFRFNGELVAMTENERKNQYMYFGCWYYPKGNWKYDGKMEPFKTGKACSDCSEGQTCEEKLCVGEMKCKDENKDCVMYEKMGYCKHKDHKVWMEMFCRQTCETCTGGDEKACEDLNANDCPRYFSKTVTAAQKKQRCDTPYMAQHCRKTCDLC